VDSDGKKTAYNSTYKKLAVQWLNEVLCFVSGLVVVESLVLRNRQLLVAANRQAVKKLCFFSKNVIFQPRISLFKAL